MSDLMQFVIFRLDGRRFGLPLDVVDRIVRAVEITPLPGAPEVVLGVVDVAGQVLPVLNLRRRFGLPEREIGPDDHFLIARAQGRIVALVMDEADDVRRHPTAGIVDASPVVPGVQQIRGLARTDDGMILIHDPERFLSPNEGLDLTEALDCREREGHL